MSTPASAQLQLPVLADKSKDPQNTINPHLLPDHRTLTRSKAVSGSKRKRAETKTQEIKRKVDEGLQRKQRTEDLRREKSYKRAERVVNVMIDEVVGFKAEGYKEAASAFLCGWRNTYPEGRNWKEAQMLVEQRNSRQYEQYLKLHDRFKHALPLSERVALGSAKRRRNSETLKSASSKTKIGARSFQCEGRVHTMSEIQNQDEEPAQSAPTEDTQENTVIVKGDGGCWKITFVPDS